MSVFYCAECDRLRDADFSGCEEVAGDLVCTDCAEELGDGPLSSPGMKQESSEE